MTCCFVDCLAVFVIEYEVHHKTGKQLSIENERCLSCQFNAGLVKNKGGSFPIMLSTELSLCVVLF